MGLIISNPLGFWALLGIPAILLIHFLQQQRRTVVISTLFLLDKVPPRSVGGRRLDRLRNSVPLWLQLLAVLIVTWLLIQPRWLREDSVQRVVVVLDSSASMSAFADRARSRLREDLPLLASSAARTEWILLETDAAKPTLYSGLRLPDLLAVLDDWEPTLGQHGFEPALNVARTLTDRSGLIIFVTDHAAGNRTGIETLMVGEASANIGFTGLVVRTEQGEPRWKALVRNYGDERVETVWRTEIDGRTVGEQSLVLEGGQTRALSGSFPDGADALTLVLPADAFPLDDRLPIVNPEPKQIVFSLPFQPGSVPPTPQAGFLERLARSFPSSALVGPGQSADIYLRVADLRSKTSVEIPGRAIVVVRDTVEPIDFLDGLVIAERDPLTHDLAWQGLIAENTLRLRPGNTDRVLLWQGSRALVFVKRDGGLPRLYFNLDPAHSNMARLPSFVVLAHRFVEQIRESKVAATALNIDTGQAIRVATQLDGDPVVVDAPAVSGEPADKRERTEHAPARNLTLYAPTTPGFFTITQGEQQLVRGAAAFSDVREADLSDAESGGELTAQIKSQAEQNSSPDPFAPLWLVALGGCLLFSWWWLTRRAKV